MMKVIKSGFLTRFKVEIVHLFMKLQEFLEMSSTKKKAGKL